MAKRTSNTNVPILSEKMEQVLRAVFFYRYVTALDIAHLLYSPTSLTYVRSMLRDMAGGEDHKTGQLLFRIRPPSVGNSERVYTLGSRGRNVLAELGVPAEWYFRPEKVKHMSYSHLTHNLILTKILVAAHSWAKQDARYKISRIRICYELAQSRSSVSLGVGREKESVPVVPDAWLEFEKEQTGGKPSRHPVLLEIDRGTQFQHRFKKHILSRIEYIESGLYEKIFGTQAVLIAYATTGAKPEFSKARRVAICAWTKEVLEENKIENWASIFRFHSLSVPGIYSGHMFEEADWFRPDANRPTSLLPG